MKRCCMPCDGARPPSRWPAVGCLLAAALPRLPAAYPALSHLSRAPAVVCWVCGLDPLGGASLSLDTARAAAVGGAAALPLVALKALLWSEQARRQWDFLDDIHRVQVGGLLVVAGLVSCCTW